MAVKAHGTDLVIAVTLIVLGVLVLVGQIGLGPLVPLLGIVLIVIGVLMLLGTVGGGTTWGVVLVVLGLALQLDWFNVAGRVNEVLRYVVGIALLVFGVMRMTGR